MIEEGTTRTPVSQILAAKDKVKTYDDAKAAQNAQNTGATGDATNTGATGDATTTQTPALPPEPTPDERRLAAIVLETALTETINDENGNPVEYYVEQEFTKNDFLIVENLNDTTSFQNALREGIYYFATYDMNEDTGKKEFNIKGIDTLGSGAISDVYDKSDDAAAQAEYESVQSRVQSIDKKLEMRLDQLETERNAIQTEMDSVQKVIEDNIEKSFNTFS